MGVSCIVDSIGDKMSIVVEQNFQITWRLALMKRQVGNRLPMPEDSRS
jgi:hypothetical protein